MNRPPTGNRPARRTAILAALAALAVPFALSASPRDVSATTDDPEPADAADAARRPQPCDPDVGLTLPDGFCATVFATGLTDVRQLTVAPDGRLFAAIADARDGTATGGIAGLRDDDGDGHADRIERFGDAGGNGVDFQGDWLYFAENGRIVRYAMAKSRLVPQGAPEVLVDGLPTDGDHVNKTVVVDGGRMYVNIGSASNACQVENRVPFSPGVDPCPELDVRAGVWRFWSDVVGQTQADGLRWATGTRNMVALDDDPSSGELFGVQNGRDQLFDNWPDRYTAEDDLVLPAEELFRLRRGHDYGWPYCYFDPDLGQKVLNPEYGGDGTRVGRCESADDPLVTFPAHWAPLAMAFTPDAAAGKLPAEYRNGAFVAFHGSRFDPAAQPEGPGYNVAFVPFQGERPSGDWSVFADGFAGTTDGLPDSAAHRPVGLAIDREGAIYVSDDRGGLIYRIVHVGAGGVPTPPAPPTPEMAGVIDAIASFDAPPLPTLSPEAARNLPSIPDWVAAAAASAGVTVTPEPVADIAHVTIPSGDTDLLARVYTPATSADDPLPVVVYYHGGGWVLANLSTYDASARAIANAAGAIVVSVAYRQAPEHPFPTPLDDAYAAYRWVVDNAASIGGDPADVAVAGESAGGNLATVVALRARDDGAQAPTHQLLVYPVTNRGFDTPSYVTYADAVPLDRPSMEWFWGHYLTDESDGANPLASPLRAESLAGLPPATVILAQIDPLFSEGQAYARALAADGVDTTLCVYAGVTHEFFGMGALLPEALAAQAAAGARLSGDEVSDPACSVVAPA